MVKRRSSEDLLRQLRQVAQTVVHAVAVDTLEELLQNIAVTARELIGARYAALGVPDDRGGLKYFKVSGMSDDEIEQIAHPPVGLGLLGKLMEDPDPLRLPHMSEHPAAIGFPEGHPRMDRFMGVPIKVNGKLYGIFYLTDKDNDEPFSEDDQWLLEILAAYAALVIAQKNLQEQRDELTVMRERQAIAMALHDSVIQSIYGLGMRLDLARRSGNVTEEDLRATLDGLNQVIEDIRAFIFRIRPGDDTLTPERRLRRLLGEIYTPPETSVEMELGEMPVSPPDTLMETAEMMIYECISNAVRHGQAENVRIRVHKLGEKLEIIIEDNGIGFDTDKLMSQSGLGIRNLTRRARMFGGIVDVDSAEGEGTTVTIRLSLL
ncbi:MAG: GAF domain-containing sensor histidine kinase [Chloroflexota bacterium]